MASERIAEVIAAHNGFHFEDGENWFWRCTCGHELFGRDKQALARMLPGKTYVESLLAAHQAEQLAAAGFGHVPTALRQAADDMQEVVEDMQSQGEGHPEFHAGALATIKSFRGAIYDAYPESRADRAGGEV